MTLQAPLLGLRFFCELPWPFQCPHGKPWARAAHADLEVDVAVIVLKVACRLLLSPRLPQAWGSKLCMGIAIACAAVQAGDLAEGFSVWLRCKNSLSCDQCVLSSLAWANSPSHLHIVDSVWTRSYLFAGANDCLCTQSWGEGTLPSFSLAHVPLEQVVGPHN